MEFRGVVGADLVTVVLDERLTPLGITINPKIMEFHDLKLVEDSLKHALTDALLQFSEWSYNEVKRSLEIIQQTLDKGPKDDNSTSGNSALN